MGKLVFKNIRKYIFKTGDKSLNKLFRDEVNTNSKNYFALENLAEGNYFYKYFPLGNAIKCLNDNTMAFVEPSRWNDAYERLFYEADYSLVSSEYQTHPLVYATCATYVKYNEPAWGIYSGDDKICVQFEIDRPRLRYEIIKSLDNGDSVYEGVVQYATKRRIQRLGKKKNITKNGNEINNKDYDLFISNNGIPFGIANYLNLLLLKRQDFHHEQESRFFIVKKEDVDNQTEKAKEDTYEVSDSTGRRSYVTHGKVKILNNIQWIKVLKSITINAEEKHYAYKLLRDTVNQMIDREIGDPTEKAKLKAKLEPVSYLVYGKTPDKITIEK